MLSSCQFALDPSAVLLVHMFIPFLRDGVYAYNWKFPLLLRSASLVHGARGERVDRIRTILAFLDCSFI
jgi:hypothetical protein